MEEPQLNGLNEFDSEGGVHVASPQPIEATTQQVKKERPKAKSDL
jgi:hypothetical protein